jgi:anti-sigma regulatory factor (Ser/Thr protein kinase)
MKFQYPMHIQSIARLRVDLEAAARKLALPSPELRQIRLIAEELFSRLVHRGHWDQGEELVLVLDREGSSIGLEMAHPGTAYNPLETDEHHHSDPLLQEEAGMGLALIEAFADHLEYRYDQGMNRVRIRKDIRSKNT